MNHNGRLTFTVAVLVGGLLLAGGCGGPATAPTNFASFNAKDGAFKCDYPADWEAEGGGVKGYFWAKFTSGSAEISIQSGSVGSVQADVINAGNRMAGVQEDEEELAPVAQLHEMRKTDTAKDLGDYQEQPPKAIRPKLGDGRKSQFTASGTFGGGIRGYRATVLSHNKSITVLCQCAEGDWETLKPAFDRVIDSLALGKAKFR